MLSNKKRTQNPNTAFIIYIARDKSPILNFSYFICNMRIVVMIEIKHIHYIAQNLSQISVLHIHIYLYKTYHILHIV